MSLLLYCTNGVVLATHDSNQNILASAYGDNVSIIPWSLPISALQRIGTPPDRYDPRADTRPYAAPTISGASQLGDYAQTKQQLILNGGISVNVGTTLAPVMVEASTDSTSLVFLQGAYSMAQANSSATFQWVQNDGVPTTLTSAQIIKIFNAVTVFIQSSFTTLAQVIPAIVGGTITTQELIDNPPTPIPAWPGNS